MQSVALVSDTEVWYMMFCALHQSFLALSGSEMRMRVNKSVIMFNIRITNQVVLTLLAA